jgi:hypothetical protein
VGDLQIGKVLEDARRQIPDLQPMEEAHADPCGIGGQPEHVVHGFALGAVETPALEGFEQHCNRLDAFIRVVVLAEDLGQDRIELGVPLCPADGGGVAHLEAVARAFAEQVVEGGGVGKGGGFATGALAPWLLP